MYGVCASEYGCVPKSAIFLYYIVAYGMQGTYHFFIGIDNCRHTRYSSNGHMNFISWYRV